MMRKANKARGEVAVTLGGEPLILCATMENLSALEEATDKGLTSFMMAVGDKRLSALKAGVESLCVDGDTSKAFANMRGGQALIEMSNAITSAMIPDEEGNAEAGAEKA